MAEEIDYAQLNYEALMQIEADNYTQSKGNRPSSPENRLLMDLGSIVGCALVAYSSWIFLYRIARGHWPNPLMLLMSPGIYMGREVGKLLGWAEEEIEEIIEDELREIFNNGISDSCKISIANCMQSAGSNPFKIMACGLENASCIL